MLHDNAIIKVVAQGGAMDDDSSSEERVTSFCGNDDAVDMDGICGGLLSEIENALGMGLTGIGCRLLLLLLLLMLLPSSSSSPLAIHNVSAALFVP